MPCALEVGLKLNVSALLDRDKGKVSSPLDPEVLESQTVFAGRGRLKGFKESEVGNCGWSWADVSIVRQLLAVHRMTYLDMVEMNGSFAEH